MPRARLFVTAVLLSCAPALAAPVVAQSARAISQSDKAQGAQANPELVTQFGGRYTGAQSAYVERVGKRVALQSGLSNSERDFTVQLLNSPVENAFAIPGGYIYVTRQLLALMNSESELAFVMGHEVGHVAARHSAGRQRTTGLAGIAASVLGGLAGNSTLGRLVGSGAQQAAGLFSLKYGRDQEYQADTLGIRYAAGASYDPGAAPRILGQLGASTALDARISGQSANAAPSWLSTHPSSAARVTRARQQAQATGRAGSATVQDVAFLRMLDGLRYDDDPAQGVIDGQTFRHPVLRLRFTAPAGYKITNAADTVTVAGSGGQAQLAIAAPSSSLSDAVAERFRTIGAQVDAGQVRDATIGGNRAAAATITANTSNGRVDASVVAVALGGATYTWTILTPAGRGAMAFDPLLTSFSTLSQAEASAIRGKVIRIHTVKAGDTLDSLARQMAYPGFQRERFLTLNGLDASGRLTPGMLVKLVVTG